MQKRQGQNMNNNEKINAEILFILSQFPANYMSKIPQDVTNFLNENMSKEHFESLDPNKTFYKQDLCDEAYESVFELIKKYM